MVSLKENPSKGLEELVEDARRKADRMKKEQEESAATESNFLEIEFTE